MQAKKPRYFVFENVKGLLSHESGQTFRTIVSTLAELGYDLQWQVLNSKDFGVPQNRERVFIVGHLGGTPRPEVFPLAGCGGPDVVEATAGVPQSVSVYSPDGVAPTLFGNCTGGGKTLKIVQPQIARWQNKKDGIVLDDVAPALRASGGTDIRKRACVVQRGRGNNPGGPRSDELAPTLQKGFGDGNVALVEMTEGVAQGNRVYSAEGIFPAIRRGSGYPNANVAVLQTVATLGDEREDGRYRPRERVMAPGVARAVTTFETQMPWYETRPPQGARLQERDGIFPTLSANPAGGTKIEPLRNINGIRRLTPVECERLQGFPDKWTEGVSDSQRYKCLGNAVTVNVVREIVTRLTYGQAA